MKTSLQQLFILFAIIVSPHAFSQTPVVDQVNEVYYPPATWNIEYFHPMGQEFKPTLTSLNFFELMLMDFSGRYGASELAVSIHTGTITGPVIGVSQSLSLWQSFQGVAQFNFDTAVSLTPGDTYVMQVDVASGGDWGVGSSGTSSYAYGRELQSGVPVAGDDLFFREGIIAVPEPSTLACSGLGLAILSFFVQSRRRP